jgi:hypothetical protein
MDTVVFGVNARREYCGGLRPESRRAARVELMRLALMMSNVYQRGEPRGRSAMLAIAMMMTANAG